MRIPRIYLETSIFNFVFADDSPDKKSDTLILLDEIKAGKYKAFTSVHVTKELDQAPLSKAKKMSELLKKYNVSVLPSNVEIEQLANVYISEGIIPSKYSSDALHIAAATVYDLDFITSWNFKHIVKRKTIIMTEVVNARYGYKKIGIYSPTEVIEND